MNSKKITLIVLVILVLIGTGAAYWYFLSDNQSQLVSSLTEEQRASVSRFLDSQGVSYSTNESGDILVDSDLIPAIRMKLMEKGVIQNERVGFEIFTEADYGMTEFAQKVNFQRALQGELEKSILTIQNVSSARVHIVLPKKGTLFSKNQNASASVLIHLESGAKLNNSSIEGIQYLVASAVDELSKEDVTVLDKNGVILSNYEYSPSQNESSINTLKTEVEYLLAQWFEQNSFAVTLSIVRNGDKREKSIETISPDNQSFLISHKETSTGNSKKKDGNSNKSVEKQYAYSKEIEKIEYSRGKVERINCAIVIKHKLTEAQIKTVYQVISAAIGLNKTRGDTLEISTLMSIESDQDANATISPELSSDNYEQVPKIDFEKSSGAVIDEEAVFNAMLDKYFGVLVLVSSFLCLIFLILFYFIINAFNRKRNEKEAKEKVLTWLSESR